MWCVSGEALLDVFEAGVTRTGLALDAVVGGSPFNVAMGLARLGQPVAFLGAVSRDFLGARIERQVREEGIDTRALVGVDAPTTLSLVGLDAQGHPSYRFYGEGGADRQLQPQHLSALPPQLAGVHIGSYACVVEPIGGTLRALVAQHRTRCPVAYDVNVRLNVQPDLAAWRETLDWMSAQVHLLKLSDEDFERLHPGEAIDTHAAQWLARGVCIVFMTRGAQGASVWTREGRIDVAAPRVEVVDTVGAGDTFQAAALTALSELGLMTASGLAGVTQAQCRTVAEFAVRSAGITCTRRGADLPRRSELPAVQQ
jgi:fructokinase